MSSSGFDFAVQKSTGSQKCSQRTCGKPITAGEPVFLTTTVSCGERGSCMGYHPKCAFPDQVASVDWSKVEGWGKLGEELQEEVKKAFKEVLENKNKKVASPAKRKAADASTKASAKSSKSSKNLTPAKAKEKAEKAEKALRDKKDGPKRALSSYMFFAAAERQNVIEQNGGPSNCSPTVAMKLIAAAWKAADAETKNKYEAEAKADKERFLRQQKEFEETGKFTKDAAEIEADKTREEKLKASKEKEKQKRLAAKQEKKDSSGEKKSDKAEKSDELEADAQEAEGGEKETEEVEDVEEEATKDEGEEAANDEVEDADAGED